jgi:hypothetical protein
VRQELNIHILFRKTFSTVKNYPRRIECQTAGNICNRRITSKTLHVKIRPRKDHEVPEGEWRYSSTLSLTSALDGGGWLRPRPGRFTPMIESLYALYSKLGRPQGRSGWVRKKSPPHGFDPRIIQPLRVALPTELSRPTPYE